jgi:hypothetical protein
MTTMTTKPWRCDGRLAGWRAVWASQRRHGVGVFRTAASRRMAGRAGHRAMGAWQWRHGNGWRRCNAESTDRLGGGAGGGFRFTAKRAEDGMGWAAVRCGVAMRLADGWASERG